MCAVNVNTESESPVAPHGFMHPATRRELEGMLRRERARADRGGRPFALVIFRGPRNAQHAKLIKPIAAAVQLRMRETDEWGWLDGKAIYAVLFDTGSSGARQFVADVCQAVQRNIPRPGVTVYSYPAMQGSDKENSGTFAGLSVELDESGADIQKLSASLAMPLPAWKRAMDIVGATCGLIALSPILLATAAAIKLTSPGPVMFCQQRSGLGGKPFTLFKFRTMVVDAEQRKQELMEANEQDGPAFKMRNDPRITPIGAFLRKSSIDELPQLWNVLRGDMTLVGPRPLPCGETAGTDQWHRKRLDVTPGLTCIWQIEGRNRVNFDDWMRMDVRYIRRRNVLHDMKLILLTIPAMLWKRNGQ